MTVMSQAPQDRMEAVAAGLVVEVAMAITKAVASSTAFEEMRLVWGFNDQVIDLNRRFSYIHALLNDLGSAKHAAVASQLVNLWLQGIKEVASSAENLLDDHAYEMLRRKLELRIMYRPSFRKKFRNYLTPSTSPILFRCQITHRVNHILSELDEVDKIAKTIGLQQVQLATTAYAYTSAAVDPLHQARRHAAAKDSEFIGREQDQHKLLQMLLNPASNQSDLPIIAIVGIGGLGKTTLARRLYKHREVEGHFDGVKIWICVSEDFNVVRLLKEMVESVTKTACDLENTGAIIDKLQVKLKGKKLFLVLDDVWNDNKELWHALKAELQRIDVLNGSVILITTRSDNVAKKACASDLHKLDGLSMKDGWTLLKNQVSFDSSYDEIGTRVLEKCKGVPLAIKAIGGMNPSDWYRIETSELWDIKQDDKNYIMPSLLLSYNHLNHRSVKQCFACIAIFPKDSIMEKAQLVALWLAQGFLDDEYTSSNSTSTIETIGEQYVDILVNSSLLVEVENEGYETRYKMHDLVHDLATYVLKKDLLVWKIGVKLDDASHFRHLAFNLQKKEQAPEIPNKKGEIRTISFWGGVPQWNSLICAPYIRTLIMANIRLKEVPTVIGDLVHLRYLDLSYNKMEVLPESMCKLYQLQTLRLLGCYRLLELPEELHMLENLRHINTSINIPVSKGLHRLTCLQTLPLLELHDGEGWTIDELGPLDQVKGDIDIKGLENARNKEEAREANLGRKEKIVRLSLSWDESSEDNLDEDVLDRLEPHPNIQLLSISGFMGVRFPGWIMLMSVKHLQSQSRLTTLLSRLTMVELKGCRRCQNLPSLGQLPYLRILQLLVFDSVECIGEEFYEITNPNSTGIGIPKREVMFPSLRELYIKRFGKLTSWMQPSSLAFTTTAFPSLETLKIEECPQLETIPPFELQSLKHLVLCDIGGSQPLDIIKSSKGLAMLRVEEMPKLRLLPQEVSNCTSLHELKIINCENIESIPINGLLSLKNFKVDKCPSLACIPNGLSSLHKLSIRDCRRLKKLPTTFLEDCTSLKTLRIIRCPITEGDIPNIGKLQGLEELSLVNAGTLSTSSPQWIPHLHRLTELVIGGLTEEWDITLISSLPFLTRLRLESCPNFKPLPQQLQQHFFPTALRTMQLNNLYELEVLPEWIGNLSYLVLFHIKECSKLKALPSKQALLRLTKLQIFEVMYCKSYFPHGCDDFDEDANEYSVYHMELPLE